MMFAIALAAQSALPSEIVIVRAERLRETAQSNTRIDVAALEVPTGQRLDEVLRQVPGVGLFRRSPSTLANATIQGLSLRPIAPNGAGRALVSLDGVPQNDPFGGWVNWSRYDPAFIQTLELKRGAAGVGFGPTALTGVLDLTEARGQPAQFGIGLAQSNEQVATWRQSFASPGARFTAMGAIQQSDGEFAVGPNQRGLVDARVNFQATSIALVTDIARSNGSWSLRGATFSEAKGSGLMGGQSQALGLDVSIARRFEGALGQSRFILYAQGRDFANMTVSPSSNRTTATSALDQYATPSSAVGWSYLYAPSQTVMRPRLIFDGRIAQGQTRELFRFVGNDFTRQRFAGGTQNLIGLSLATPRPISIANSGWRFETTVRFDYWEHSSGGRIELDRATRAALVDETFKDQGGAVSTGSLSLAYPAMNLRLSAYKTFRPPTLNELYRPFRVGNDVTEANAKLKPETLYGLDVDWSRDWKTSGGPITSSLTVYANRLVDPIANVTIATGPGNFARVGFLPAGGSLRERQNVGSIDAKGVEAALRHDGEASAISWLFAVSATRSNVDGGSLLPQVTGKKPAQAPDWNAYANIKWPITTRLSAVMTIRGEGLRFEDDLNIRKLAAYGAVDLGFNWQIQDRTRVWISADNIFDTRIISGQTGDGIKSLAQSRSIRIGLSRTGF